MIHKAITHANKQMTGLKPLLIEELKKRKSSGMRQNELYHLLSFSRAHVSETLGSLEKEGKVIRRKEGRAANRIWLTEYFPSQVEGVLRVGILRSSEYVPFLSSLRHSLPEGYNLNVTVFDDSIELISSLHEGVLEVALAPTFTHILYSIISAKELLLGTVSYGGSSLLENKMSGNDFLATSESSTMALMSRNLVRDGKAAVHFFEEPGEASMKFLNGEYRYIAIWEPYLSWLLSTKRVEQVENDDSRVFLSPCCSVGVNRVFAEAKPKLVTRIRDDYSRFIEDLDPGKLGYGLKTVAKATGINESEILKSLLSYDFRSEINADLLSKYMINVGIPMSSGRLKEMIFDSVTGQKVP